MKPFAPGLALRPGSLIFGGLLLPHRRPRFATQTDSEAVSSASPLAFHQRDR